MWYELPVANSNKSSDTNAGSWAPGCDVRVSTWPSALATARRLWPDQPSDGVLIKKVTQRPSGDTAAVRVGVGVAKVAPTARRVLVPDATSITSMVPLLCESQL